MSGVGRRGGRTRPRAALVAAGCVAALLLSGCSDDDSGVEPSPDDATGTPSAAPPPAPDAGTTRHSAVELVQALPATDDERHGLAVFEACTDFRSTGDCLEQEPGTVVLNLSDGMDQGLLLTVVRRYRPADFTARGAVCPDGPIDEPAQELESGGVIPGREGTGKRTPWEHQGWVGWVCDADYTQVDSDGTTEDAYSLRLLLAHNGHHLLSLRTAADVDVATWAEEYVDRLEG